MLCQRQGINIFEMSLSSNTKKKPPVEAFVLHITAFPFYSILLLSVVIGVQVHGKPVEHAAVDL